MQRFFQYAMALFLLVPVVGSAQSDSTKFQSADTIAKANAELEKKAADWTAELKLADATKEKRVAAAIATHLKAIRDWNNEHPFTTVPAGINPATGNKLSQMDRQ